MKQIKIINIGEDVKNMNDDNNYILGCTVVTCGVLWFMFLVTIWFISWIF